MDTAILLLILPLTLLLGCDPDKIVEADSPPKKENIHPKDPLGDLGQQLRKATDSAQREKLIREAIKDPKNLSFKNSDDENLLHILFKDRTVAPDKTLVESIVKDAPKLLNAPDSVGKTPFVNIVQDGENYEWLTADLFDVLLKNGAALDTIFRNKQTLLHTLIYNHLKLAQKNNKNQAYEHEKMINSITNKPELKSQLNAQNAQGSLPLQVASDLPLDILIKFWELGADPDRKGTFAGSNKAVIDFTDNFLFNDNLGRSYLLYLLKNNINSKAKKLLDDVRAGGEAKALPYFAKAKFIEAATPFLTSPALKQLFNWTYIESRFCTAAKINDNNVTNELINDINNGLDIGVTNPDNPSENVLHYILSKVWQPPTSPNIPDSALIELIVSKDSMLKDNKANVMLVSRVMNNWQPVQERNKTPSELIARIKREFESAVNAGDLNPDPAKTGEIDKIILLLKP